MKAGIDIGSKNIHSVVISNRDILYKKTISHNGDIMGNLKEILSEINKNYNLIETFGFTGNIDLLNIKSIDPILASVEANKFLNSGCNNILYVGCETFYLILLDEKYNYIEHHINLDCASGTGSFIDQQAERLGYTIEELSEKAFFYKGSVPGIASRCAVFAKSDIIHAQALGFSREAISAGICEGVARSLLSKTIKGRELKGNIIFTGGVSSNKKIVYEISKSLNKEVIVVEESPYFNAIGACLLGELRSIDFDNFIRNKKSREVRELLKINPANYPDFFEDTFFIKDDVEITLYKNLNEEIYDLYLGIDVGSTSTKLIALNKKKEVLAGLYTKTMGDPVRAVIGLFKKLEKIFSGKSVNFNGVCTTGSGRKLIQRIINADLAINEISCHALGGLFLDPDIDTIIEIGGQDSKFIQIKDGSIVNAVMNYVCAAGTGSFIEEQAKKLNISLSEISNMAMDQTSPYTSDRCTVYMERDLNILLNEGWNKNELILAVLYSIKDNYLSKVISRNRIGNKVYFQGATARNRALVGIFENEIKKPVFVSKFCHLTGALGAGLYSIERNIKKSKFKSIEIEHKISNEICRLCSNMCDLKVYEVNGKKTAWGIKCGREYDDKNRGHIEKVSKLERDYFSVFDSKEKSEKKIKKIGIPFSIYMTEYYSLFGDFFNKLGFEVIVEKSSDKILNEGLKLINSDFCEPVIMAHGMVKSLFEKNVDYIFMPAIINEQSFIKKLDYEEKFMDKINDGYFCYYSEYASIIIDNLTTLDLKDKLISPKIKFNNRSIEKISEDLAVDLYEKINLTKEEIMKAFTESFLEYEKKKEKWKAIGKKIINKNDQKIKLLLLGRPYSIFDGMINLGIPKKLEDMEFEVIYQSMLDFDDIKISKGSYIEKMHWHYGQEILISLDFIAEHPEIYPVFLTCFKCSPDSYLLTYFKETMNEIKKPYLILQLDEHNSDVGYETRIEAGIETFLEHYKKKKKSINKIGLRKYKNNKIEKEDTVLIPFLSPIISCLQEHAFKAYGYKAMVMNLEQKMINLGYKFCSGGECMPNVAIIGSLLEIIKKENLRPDKTILYLPTLCLGCNFNQFTILTDFVAGNENLEGLKIANPNAVKSIEELPKELNTSLLSMNILGSILYKLLHRYSPYEKNKGESKSVLKKSIEIIKKHLDEKKSLSEAGNNIRELFLNIDINKERKPRIGILGDLYVKYNSVLNDDLFDSIEDLGGEVFIPSFTETVANLLDADIRENGLERKYLSGLNIFEGRFERMFSGLIDDGFEPPINECIELMHEFGLNHYIAGETTINISRMLYYIKHKLVDAVVHINPVFCCPGVVSSSIFRKIQKKFNIPIIDLFYDGTNKPNKIIAPYMHYLRQNK